MSQRRLPAEIYWRRRLLALAVVILLVWVGLRVFGGSDDKAEVGPRPTATTAAPTAAPVAPPVDGTVDVSLSTGAAACDPEKVRITPTVTSGQLTDGPVTIGLVVSSTAKAACTLTPDAADLLAVVSANTTPIWDSTVCKTSLLTTPVTISPTWASLVTAQWSGRGSGSTCSPKEGFATPGTYTVQVGTLGGEPGKAAFTLKARPKPARTTPAPTVTPTPTATQKTPKPPKTTTRPAD